MLGLRSTSLAIVSLELLVVASIAPLEAVAQHDALEGHWKGEVQLPGTALEIFVEFARGAEGAWAGRITIPAQNANDVPLEAITLEGSQISFVISGIPGTPTFTGTLSANREISGDLTQSGQSFPFHLASADDPVAQALEALEGLDEIVEQALEDFDTPGLGLAVVVDDDIVLARGYGYRDLENQLPVTEETLFAIGSCTKAFTTFLLGTLVDEGLIEWDRPVIEYLPEFRLYDDHATEALTVRDMVAHRSGLPRHDALWYNASFTREEIFERLRYLQPFADLRERYHYQNLMFMTAGYLAEQLTGKTWEDLVRERILDPLGMIETNFSVEDSRLDDDFAQPYRRADDEIQLIPFRNIDVIGPAGSINSSVKEMSHWLVLQLNQGAYGGHELLQASTAREMHTPVTLMSGYPSEPEFLFTAYGLGWSLQAYRGHYRVQHGGGIDGFSAMVTLLPHKGFGIVALANRSGTPVSELISRHVMDRLLGLEPKDWLGEALAQQQEGEERAEQAEERRGEARISGTSPSHPLESYAGQYEHSGYGVVEIALTSEQLTMTYNSISTPLEHWHYDVFNGVENPEDPTFEDRKLLFRSNLKGDVAEVVISMDTEVDDIVFAKLPEGRLFDPGFLAQFVGAYQLQNVEVTIDLRGNTLVASMPGQPSGELVPVRGTEFDVRGQSGLSLVFVVNEQGNVTALELHLPNGVLRAERK